MARTLMVLVTHFVDEAVISEYRKMKNTPNVDAVLAIDNTNYKSDFKSRVENRIFFGTSARCFFFDSDLHDEMGLPYFAYFSQFFYKDFGNLMWNNCDYRFYYVRKYFPDYDYYWQIEYDVFCNAPTYAEFLHKFADNRADLLITHFGKSEKNGDWMWSHGLEWVYETWEIYGSLFPVVRLSACALDFLYQRRLEHKQIFQQSTDKNKRWVGNEVFAPTELMNNGFSCEKIDEPHVGLELFYLNDDRFFLAPDNRLYHPVKSARNEISKLQQQHASALSMYRKLFMTQLVEKIPQALLNEMTVHVDSNFNFVILAIPKMGGGGGDLALRYEVRFAPEGIYISLVFDGKYSDDNNFAVVREFTGLTKQPPTLYTTPTGRALIYVVKALDNVNLAAGTLKFLIENTYPVLKRHEFYTEERR